MPMQTLMIRRLVILLAAVAGMGISAAPSGAATLFTLTGHGWGHGIGMSQYGALGYAQHGHTDGQILAHYYTGTSLGRLPIGTTERVLLTSNRPSAHVTFAAAVTARDGAGTTRTLAAGSYRVDLGPIAGKLRLWSPAAGRYIWAGIDGSLRITPGSAPLRLDDAALNGYSNDHWWGDFDIVRSGGSLSLINIVKMEKYVRGVVPCEVPASWPAEAVQAQAVAARSYAAATRSGGSFDAYPDTRSQMYCPIERQEVASDAAVAATARQVVMYAGHVATTYFSSSSGGRTSSLQASWGSPNQPYLMPVNDPYDAAGGLNPNHSWAPRLFTPTSLAAALGLPGVVRTLDHTIDQPSQRVTSVLLHTSNGDVSRTGSGVYSAMGLRSTYFRLLQVSLSAPLASTAGETFALTGRLWPVPLGPFHLEVRVGSETTWTVSKVAIGLDSEGRFSLPRTPGKDVAYRLVRGSAFSPVAHVAVSPALTLLGSNGRFSGKMFPHLAGATVTLQRHGPSGWNARDTATVGPKGGYSFLTAPSTGSWRVRFAGDADHSAGVSATLVV
jgi:stage II sporulation protein D